MQSYFDKGKYNKEFKSTVKNRKPGISRTEIFVKSDAEGAERVYKMNERGDRARINREQLQIIKDGEISEYKLRQNALRTEQMRGGN